MEPDMEEIEFMGWADHENHVWSTEEAAHRYYRDFEKGKPYTLRPCYAVKVGEKVFNGS